LKVIEEVRLNKRNFLMAFYFLSLEKAKKILVEAHKFDPDDE